MIWQVCSGFLHRLHMTNNYNADERSVFANFERKQVVFQACDLFKTIRRKRDSREQHTNCSAADKP